MDLELPSWLKVLFLSPRSVPLLLPSNRTLGMLWPMYIDWSPIYETGVRLVDDEHRQLVAILNEFHTAHVKNLGPVLAFTTLNKLVRYAEKHFSDEEGLMAKHHYPSATKHRLEHEKLLAQVFDLTGKLERRETELSLDIFDFLRGWLIDHILKTDMEMGRWLVERGEV